MIYNAGTGTQRTAVSMSLEDSIYPSQVDVPILPVCMLLRGIHQDVVMENFQLSSVSEKSDQNEIEVCGVKCDLLVRTGLLCSLVVIHNGLMSSFSLVPRKKEFRPSDPKINVSLRVIDNFELRQIPHLKIDLYSKNLKVSYT